jgi:hypothetical protein
MKKLNETVEKIYIGQESNPLEFCKNVITELGLPGFYAAPIVDRSFRGHKK